MRFNFESIEPNPDSSSRNSLTPKEDILWVPLQNHPLFTSPTSTSPEGDAAPQPQSNLLAWDGTSRLYYWDSNLRCLHRISIRLGDPEPSKVLAASPSKVNVLDSLQFNSWPILTAKTYPFLKYIIAVLLYEYVCVIRYYKQMWRLVSRLVKFLSIEMALLCFFPVPMVYVLCTFMDALLVKMTPSFAGAFLEFDFFFLNYVSRSFFLMTRISLVYRTISIGSQIYFNGRNLIHVRKVSWHPYSDTHLGILSSDSVFRYHEFLFQII